MFRVETWKKKEQIERGGKMMGEREEGRGEYSGRAMEGQNVDAKVGK